MSRVADLAWCCDLSAEENRARYAPQYPQARFTADFDDLLNDPSLDAVAVATSVPTHHPLGLRALEAGKHVFVEKPLAASVADARELVDAAEAADRRLMVGHLLLFHPALAKVRELIDSGELGEIYYLYGNRLNLGQVRADENALWSLGAHDVAVLLDLVGERPGRGPGARRVLRAPRRRGRRLRVPQVPVGRGRAPPPVLARPAQDAQADRRRLRRRWSSSTTWRPTARSRSTTRARRAAEHRLLRRVRQRALRRHLDPAHPDDEPLRLECQEFVDADRARAASRPLQRARRAWRWSRCWRRCSARSTPGGATGDGAAAHDACAPTAAARTCTSATDVTIADGRGVRRQRRRARRLLDRRGNA